jgi:plastocyanin
MFVHRRAILRAYVYGVLAATTLAAAPLAHADDATQVEIKAFNFTPKESKVAVGTTVTWTNKDPEPHTVIDKNGHFRSAALDTGDSFSFTFKDAGTYTYFCSLHPHMTGTVEVAPKP